MALVLLASSSTACDGADLGQKRTSPSAVKASAARPSASARTSTPPPATTAPGGEPATKAKIDAIMPTLRAMAADETVVEAVRTQNAKRVPLEQIKKLDEEWRGATGVADFMKTYLDNDASNALRKHAAANKAINEVFAMDDQGAIVATTSRTSDYWQGDEEKWSKSFEGGRGAEFIDKASFDESTQSYSVQVSIPVMTNDQAIGALTIGVSLDQL